MTEIKDWLFERPIAHRGVHLEGKVLENSLESFSLAIEQGHPIELDVQMTGEGEIIVFHDENFKRIYGSEGKVKESSLSDIKELGIPLLKEVLNLINGQVPLIVEIKEKGLSFDKFLSKLLTIIEEYKNAGHTEVALMSFNPVFLFKIQKKNPEIDIILAYSDTIEKSVAFWKKALVKSFVFNFFLDLKAIACDYNTINSKKWHILKMFQAPKLAWTITDEKNLIGLQKRATNLIFEDFSNKNIKRWKGSIE